MKKTSLMPRAYAECQSLEQLWHFAQEHAARTDSVPEYVFGSIGLLFVDPGKFKVCFPTPDNAMVFARTGGDGIHYSLLHVNGKVRDDSPVVMTVPFYAYTPNVVVGQNLVDFLCLGCQTGYSDFDGLTWRPSDTALDGTSLRQTCIDRIQRSYLAEELAPEEVDLLQLIQRKMKLKPWPDIAKHLDELGSQFLKNVHPSPLLSPPD